jgi:hypothetical protein
MSTTSDTKKDNSRSENEPSKDDTTQTENKPGFFAKDNLKSKFTDVKGRLVHQPVEGLDYKQRDPTNLHRGLKVNFRDVIAEPDGVHSFQTVWGTSYKTYSVSKYWCYRVMTAVLGVPFALFWGLYFAFLAFLNVWCVVPFVKCFMIQIKFISEIWSLLVKTFLDPFFLSIGLCFSKIKVELNMNRS